MKIQLASDLHLEMWPGNLPDRSVFRPVAGRDLLVLAGDIGVFDSAQAFIERELRRSPVLYVPGNHEYYSHQTHEDTDAFWKRLARRHSGLHYLTGEPLTLDGVRFWGGAWFSGLTLQRGESRKAHDDLPPDPWLLREVERSINDFSPRHDDYGAWNAAAHRAAHARETESLRKHARNLASQGLVLDMVVTHWPPTVHAIDPAYKGDPLNAYFVNDREDLVREIGAPLWVAGHVHTAFEAQVGATRVIGNPAGYPRDSANRLRKFNTALALDVEAGRGGLPPGAGQEALWPQ